MQNDSSMLILKTILFWEWTKTINKTVLRTKSVINFWGYFHDKSWSYIDLPYSPCLPSDSLS